MIYHGTVQDGVVTFPPGVQLPDGMKVVVQPTAQSQSVQSESIQTQPEPEVTMRNGFHLFPHRDNDLVPDLELVNQIRDEEL
mgnify:CR=1 FL=1